MNHTLLIGPPSSWQLFIADEMAFTAAGETAVVYLSETERLDKSVIDRLDAWSLAKKAERSIAIHRLGNARRWQSSADALAALHKAGIEPPALVVREFDNALYPADHWFTMAKDIATAGYDTLTIGQ
jgi:hypothetical protein